MERQAIFFMQIKWPPFQFLVTLAVFYFWCVEMMGAQSLQTGFTIKDAHSLKYFYLKCSIILPFLS